MIGMSGVRGLRDGRFCVGFALFTANTRHSRVPRGRSIKAALDRLSRVLAAGGVPASSLRDKFSLVIPVV